LTVNQTQQTIVALAIPVYSKRVIIDNELVNNWNNNKLLRLSDEKQRLSQFSAKKNEIKVEKSRISRNSSTAPKLEYNK
jgi:hypothetical protein